MAVGTERLTLRDADLPLDQVEAGDRLGDRMLDLDPAVELEEEEVVAVDDELDRTRAAIADRATERDCRLVEPAAERLGQAGSRCLLEHFLVSPLDRAVTLAQRDDVPMRVGQELHLDVARPLEVALAVERAVAEGAHCLALGRRERVVELGSGADDAHPSTTATRCSLDEQRKADLLRRSVGEYRDARLARNPLRGELVAAESKRLGRRADPREASGLDRLREARVLREEAVTGMHGVGARRERGANVLLRVEVARDLDQLVGRARVQGAAIVGRGNGDRLDLERTTRTEDAHGDLSPVRDEQSPDRHGRTLCSVGQLVYAPRRDSLDRENGDRAARQRRRFDRRVARLGRVRHRRDGVHRVADHLHRRGRTHDAVSREHDADGISRRPRPWAASR